MTKIEWIDETWNPVIGIGLHTEQLGIPFTWENPRQIFVDLDLFHESVSDEWRDQIFAVMTLTPRHTYQISTKRPEEMLKYFTGLIPDKAGSRWYHAIEGLFKYQGNTGVVAPEDSIPTKCSPFLPNVHLSITVENQETTEGENE